MGHASGQHSPCCLEQVNLRPPRGGSRCDLATDPPTAHDRQPDRRTHPRPEGRRLGPSVQHLHLVPGPALGHDGVRTGGHHHGARNDLAPVRASDGQPAALSLAALCPEPLGAHPEPHLIGVGPCVHAHGGTQVDLGVGLLGQGRAVVGRFRLRPEQDDPPANSCRPEQLARASARQPGAHDHHIRHEPAA